MSLEEKIKWLPHLPGVYLMKDSYGQIIYIGKSKNLKNRVSSYFQKGNHTPRVERMLNHLKDFDYIITDTEFEALMLECQLIKAYQPLYNRLLKNTEKYIYLVVNINKNPFEFQWSYERGADGNLYFGPFTNRGLAERVIQGLKDFYRIDCTNHGHSSPCLNYSIGKCIGICFHDEAKKIYKEIVWKIVALFQGKNKMVLNEISSAMKEASEQFQFERAAKLRDLLNGLKTLLKKEKVIEFAEKNKYIVVAENIKENTFKFFFIYRNQILYRQKLSFFEEWVTHISTMKENIMTCYERVTVKNGLEKEELDEAQIIFSYLQSGHCTYRELPEHVIKNEEKLIKAIEKFLKEVTDDSVEK